jgi:hypothetical protein
MSDPNKNLKQARPQNVPNSLSYCQKPVFSHFENLWKELFQNFKA